MCSRQQSKTPAELAKKATKRFSVMASGRGVKLLGERSGELAVAAALPAEVLPQRSACMRRQVRKSAAGASPLSASYSGTALRGA